MNHVSQYTLKINGQKANLGVKFKLRAIIKTSKTSGKTDKYALQIKDFVGHLISTVLDP